MQIITNSHRIPIVLTTPNSQDLHPCVIMLHGAGSNKDEVDNYFVKLAQTLKDHSIASIRLDFIGSGESIEEHIRHDFTSAITDIKTVYQYLKQQPNIDIKRIAILGFSQGGTLAILSTAVLDFKTAIFWAPSIDYHNFLTPEQLLLAKNKGYHQQVFSWRAPLNFSYQWLQDALCTDYLSAFKKVNYPNLIIHGLCDDIVDYHNSQLLQASNPYTTLSLIDNANHVFNAFENQDTFSQVSTITIEWIMKFL